MATTVDMAVSIKAAPANFEVVRCPGCNHMLFRVWMPLHISAVSIEIRCSSCKQTVTWPSYEKAEVGGANT